MLSDPEKRKQYDTFGQNFRPGQGAGGFAARPARAAEGFDLGDLFGGLFARGGAGAGRGARERGAAPTSRWRCGSRSRTPSAAQR